jgi:hypothetical protein
MLTLEAGDPGVCLLGWWNNFRPAPAHAHNTVTRKRRHQATHRRLARAQEHEAVNLVKCYVDGEAHELSKTIDTSNWCLKCLIARHHSFSVPLSE